MNESVLVECASWIYSHKQNGHWWTPYVLTSHNQNSNPNVNIDVAYDVFAELVRRRLMVHTIVPANGTHFPAFKINPEKDAEWQTLIKKRGPWSLTVLPTIIWLIKQSWLLGLFIGGVLLSNYLAIKVQTWAKDDTPASPTEIRLIDEQFENVLHSIQPNVNSDNATKPGGDQGNVNADPSEGDNKAVHASGGSGGN
ncbi:MAG: hypothetical protein R3E01_04085 [Pirellulaceae bacterium]